MGYPKAFFRFPTQLARPKSGPLILSLFWANFYFEDEPTRRNFMGRMTKRQAEQAAKPFVGGATDADTGARPMQSPERFAQPWKLIENDASFEIVDAAGVS